MNPSYQEYLKSMGASEDDIKILATPLAIKAYDKQQADLAAASAAVTAAEQSKKDYETRSTQWHDTVNGEYLSMKDQLVVAKANEAKARAVIDEAQKQGLIKVAEDLGYVTAPPAPAAGTPPAFDPSKVPTWEQVQQLAEREGDAIAMAQDLAAEHARLFPGTLLNFRELRREAVSRKLSVEQLWMDKYKVADARTAATAAAQKSHDDKLREEGASVARAELASRYGNPDARPLEASQSPFAPRAAANREKQPWESGTDGENGSNDRVQRATKSLIERQTRPN